MNKDELDRALLTFQPEVLFAATSGGVRLMIIVDAWNGTIYWDVVAGDHHKQFNSYDKARDYFLENQ